VASHGFSFWVRSTAVQPAGPPLSDTNGKPRCPAEIRVFGVPTGGTLENRERSNMLFSGDLTARTHPQQPHHTQVSLRQVNRFQRPVPARKVNPRTPVPACSRFISPPLRWTHLRRRSAALLFATSLCQPPPGTGGEYFSKCTLEFQQKHTVHAHSDPLAHTPTDLASFGAGFSTETFIRSSLSRTRCYIYTLVSFCRVIVPLPCTKTAHTEVRRRPKRFGRCISRPRHDPSHSHGTSQRVSRCLSVLDIV
jgi:hypothetical protein